MPGDKGGDRLQVEEAMVGGLIPLLEQHLEALCLQLQPASREGNRGYEENPLGAEGLGRRCLCHHSVTWRTDPIVLYEGTAGFRPPPPPLPLLLLRALGWKRKRGTEWQRKCPPLSFAVPLRLCPLFLVQPESGRDQRLKQPQVRGGRSSNRRSRTGPGSLWGRHRLAAKGKCPVRGHRFRNSRTEKRNRGPG